MNGATDAGDVRRQFKTGNGAQRFRADVVDLRGESLRAPGLKNGVLLPYVPDA